MRAALRGGVLGVSLAACLGASEARAAGLYFSDRGVRPLGRAGAFVAGADDLGAVWYNPAGLSDAGGTFLADFAWLRFTSDYTRRTQVTDQSGTVRVFDSPTVQGSTGLLPIPTLAGAFGFGARKQWVIAASLLAPYTPIPTYPERVPRPGDPSATEPSPSRYSLVSLDGSALVVPALQVAYKPIEQVRFGLGVNALVGAFQSTVVFSASPPRNVISSSEDPAYDALSRLRVGPIFAPSANAGLILVPHRVVRLGFSVQLPFVVNAPATIDVRLPSAVPFDNARQRGKDASVRFVLPAVLRAGVEVRPAQALRVEATFVRELWATHHAIDISPENVQLQGVTGFPSPFAVSAISLPRNFQNASSYRLGGEYRIPLGTRYALEPRAGISYEESAVPLAYLSPLTIDLSKVTGTIGGSLHVGEHWRFDAVYAHVFAADATVDPAEARVPRVNPVQGNPTATEPVNGGTYAARADVLGVGLHYKL